MPYVIVGICYRVLRNVEIWGNILYLAYPSFPTWVSVPNLIVQRVRRKYGLISYKHPPTLDALPCPVWLPYVERCLLHRGSRKVAWSRQLVIACRWPELTHWADWIWSLFWSNGSTIDAENCQKNWTASVPPLNVTHCHEKGTHMNLRYMVGSLCFYVFLKCGYPLHCIEYV